jgi:hypothetical protein
MHHKCAARASALFGPRDCVHEASVLISMLCAPLPPCTTLSLFGPRQGMVTPTEVVLWVLVHMINPQVGFAVLAVALARGVCVSTVACLVTVVMYPCGTGHIRARVPPTCTHHTKHFIHCLTPWVQSAAPCT